MSSIFSRHRQSQDSFSHRLSFLVGPLQAHKLPVDDGGLPIRDCPRSPFTNHFSGPPSRLYDTIAPPGGQEGFNLLFTIYYWLFTIGDLRFWTEPAEPEISGRTVISDRRWESSISDFSFTIWPSGPASGRVSVFICVHPRFHFLCVLCGFARDNPGCGLRPGICVNRRNLRFHLLRALRGFRKAEFPTPAGTRK